MNQLETYHKLRDVQRTIKLASPDLDYINSNENPVAYAVALAYDNAFNILGDVANTLYRTSIEDEAP